MAINCQLYSFLLLNSFTTVQCKLLNQTRKMLLAHLKTTKLYFRHNFLMKLSRIWSFGLLRGTFKLAGGQGKSQWESYYESMTLTGSSFGQLTTYVFFNKTTMYKTTQQHELVTIIIHTKYICYFIVTILFITKKKKPPSFQADVYKKIYIQTYFNPLTTTINLFLHL